MGGKSQEKEFIGSMNHNESVHQEQKYEVAFCPLFLSKYIMKLTR